MNAPPSPDVSVVTIATITGRGQNHSLRRMMVNGIAVYAKAGGSSYVIPSLHAELAVAGPPQSRVLRSLTYSPRYVALAARRDLTVPRSWRWITFSHLRIPIPKSWKVSELAHQNPCSNNDRLSVAGVTLVKGPVDESVPEPLGPCGGGLSFGPAPQVAGIEVDQGAWAKVPSLFNPPHCVGSGVINNLRVCVRATPDLGLMIVQVESKGVAPVTVKIGMAGNGTEGRIILHSLRRSS
jgi:hypothetical protein